MYVIKLLHCMKGDAPEYQQSTTISIINYIQSIAYDMCPSRDKSVYRKRTFRTENSAPEESSAPEKRSQTSLSGITHLRVKGYSIDYTNR